MNYIREIVVRSRCVGRSTAERDGRGGVARGRAGRVGGGRGAAAGELARTSVQSVRAVQIGRVVSGIRSDIREEPRAHDRRRRAEPIADRRRHRSSSRRRGSSPRSIDDRRRSGSEPEDGVLAPRGRPSARVRARTHARTRHQRLTSLRGFSAIRGWVSVSIEFKRNGKST